jgi:MFS family permease
MNQDENLTTHEATPGGQEELSPSEAASRRGQHRALFIVFLVMFIDLLGFAIVLPLLPRYGRDFLNPLLSDQDSFSVKLVRGLVLGGLMASFSAMQFLFAPIWGRISDRKGRRPFLLLGLAGSVAFYTLFGFASDWGAAPGRQLAGLILLFVGRIGAGIAGATVSTAQAVIADSTTPQRRSRGMALIGAAFGIGFLFGPILGAGALKFFPESRGAPGYAAAGLSLIGLVLAVILMPETWKPGSAAGKRGWLNLSGLRLVLDTPTVSLLILTFFLSTFAFGNFETTLTFLTQDVLHYGEEDNFWIFAYVGLVLVVAQGGLYQTLARRGVSEIRFMLTGATLMIVGLGTLGGTAALAGRIGAGSTSLLLVFLMAMTAAVTGFAFVTPSVQALISRRSDPARQGEILGVNQSANALSRILGPMAGVGLYQQRPALPYAFAVSLVVIVICLSLRVRQA